MYTPPVAGETAHRTALIWADPAQASWLSVAATRAGLKTVGAGSPESGRGPEVVAGLCGDRDAAPAFDDLRAMLHSAQADVVLIASPGDFAGGQRQGTMDREDASALAACRGRGVRVATIEPMPCSALQLGVTIDALAASEAEAEAEVVAAPAGAGVVLGQGSPLRAEEPREAAARVRGANDAGGGWARTLPLLRHSRATREAADVLEHFGHVRTVMFRGWCTRGQGSLGARLFDALDTIVSLLGTPEQVHATYVWPVRGRPVHPTTDETLRGLSGDLTANLRFADGRTAAVAVSDCASRWSRAVTLIGDGGRLCVSDDAPDGMGTGTGGFVWLNADGTTVDVSRSMREARTEGRTDEALVEAVADALSRLLDPRVPAPAPTDTAAVLATAGAALLSARTGEAELPDTILRMVKGR